MVRFRRVALLALFGYSCCLTPSLPVLLNRGFGTHTATCGEYLARAPAGIRWHLTDCVADPDAVMEVRGLFGAGSLKEAYVPLHPVDPVDEQASLYIGFTDQEDLERLLATDGPQDVDVSLVFGEVLSKEAKKLERTVQREHRPGLVVGYAGGFFDGWWISLIAFALVPWVFWAMLVGLAARLNPKKAAPPTA